MTNKQACIVLSRMYLPADSTSSKEAIEKAIEALELPEAQAPARAVKSTLSFTHGYDFIIWECGNCGNQLRSFANYCDKCGRKVQLPEPPKEGDGE